MTPPHLAGRLLGLLLLTTTCSTALAQQQQQQQQQPGGRPFEFRDGDRVALIGNTFIEREQVYSYLETLLRSRHPDKNITFRNLGWSGDTVFGHARSYFDPPEKGFERLDKIVHELKPTVIFISYGMGESFDGEAGLPAFRQGFERLLDMLKDLDARTVILGPTRHEDLGPPLPDPAAHNASLRLYADALKEIAASRGHRFIDLYEALGDGAKANPPTPLTDNGIHLTPYGYWRAAGAIAQALGVPAGERTFDVRPKPGATSVTLPLAREALPPCPPPPGAPRTQLPGYQRVIKVAGLGPAQRFVLTAGGQTVASGTGAEWEKGIEVLDDPPAKQAEKAREVAIFKNLQYFNQWRPANETYIFGFRAYEQGKNAAEMPMFNEPIAKLEAEIAKLVQPVEVTYELKPE
jgi:lysophospholipase L1-like esterase